MNIALLDLAKKVGAHLQFKNWKLVTAESCTGGGLAYWITSAPGSSNWFDRAFVTYSNEAKQEMLLIDPTLLTHYGAYSEEVALMMANNALSNSQAHVSVSITGVVGPAGGTDDIPVGTVWIALKSPTDQYIAKHYFKGDRFQIREQIITTALENILNV